MTGGRVVIIGRTGRNFAAGMSGGIAYVLDEDEDFHIRCNRQMVHLETIAEEEDVATIKQLLTRHVQYTHSSVGRRILDNWRQYQGRLIKVMPKDYKIVLEAIRKGREKGLSEEEAIMEAAHG